jgi:hypothetical protein
MTEKYSNGLYKTTSKKQDNTSRVLWTSIKIKKYMSYNLDQVTGLLTCRFFLHTNGYEFMTLVIDRGGLIVEKV